LDNGFSGYIDVLINVSIKNAGNRTIRIRHHEPVALTTFKNVYYPLNIEFLTHGLTAGTYPVQVYWKFVFDVTATHQFFFKLPSMTGDSHKRSLLVQELA